MTSPASAEWNPALYAQFGGLRLRPAMDLLGQVFDVPEGPLVDLGCGSGAAGPAIHARFPDHELTGVDQSPAMLQEAEATGAYTSLAQCDAAEWNTAHPVALIFANALLNWLPDHAALLPSLASNLMPGGVLAVQSPKQQEAPSHALLRTISADLFPDKFDWSQWQDSVLDLPSYHRVLSPLGDVALWETTYGQVLPAPAEGHPVRRFTQATAARRVTDHLDEAEAAEFFSAYDAVLEDIYPRQPDGSVLFPFRRIFFVLHRSQD
ncbi:MAG: methyltransferase domain-containing protein [Pseudomonadota bacterium]